MSDLKHRIYAMGKELQLMNVATVSPDNKPRVRYVVGKMDQELNLRFSTHLSSPKIEHLKANPVVSVTLGASHPGSPQWLQVEGRAEIVTSKEEREAFWFDALGAHFKGPDDPVYCIVLIRPTRIELGSIENPQPEVWQ